MSSLVQRVGDYKWLVCSNLRLRVASPPHPPAATLMEYIFRLIEHSAENQFSFGNAQSTHHQVNKGAHLIFFILFNL